MRYINEDLDGARDLDGSRYSNKLTYEDLADMISSNFTSQVAKTNVLFGYKRTVGDIVKQEIAQVLDNYEDDGLLYDFTIVYDSEIIDNYEVDL